MPIKNVVFDIGNVLVRWAPYEVLQEIFPDHNPIALYEKIRPVWLDLNCGKLTEDAANVLYQQQLGVSEADIAALLHRFKTSQTPIVESMALLDTLQQMGMGLYSITDNVKEIMEYHRNYSNFLPYFRGVVVSADLGVLKPDPRIYRHLLETYDLNASESVFIDDMLVNVEGAKAVGMQAFQFTDPHDCKDQLVALGIKLQ